jgi:MFS family permease
MEPDPAAHPDPTGLGRQIPKIAVIAIIGLFVGWLAAAKLNLGTVPGWVIGTSIFGVGTFALMNLKETPTALWVVFVLKLFTVVAYKLITVVLVSFLIKDCGVGDSQAQWIFGIWGIFMSLATLLAGSITDAVGIRRTLIIGITLCLVTRLVLMFSGNSAVVLLLGLIPLAAGEALCTPVLVAATRNYTNAAQRSVAFSVFYSILNLGFMFAYFIRDGIQTGAADSGGSFQMLGFDLSAQRMLFAISFGVEFVALACALTLRERCSTGQQGENLADTIGRTAVQTGRLFVALVRHPAFRRLLLFLLMIGLLKIVFNIMDAVLPTFAEREIGIGGKNSVGRLNAVNSILILVLAPLVGSLTKRIPAYPMVIFGGFVTAAAFTFMVLPADRFIGLASSPFGRWFGHQYLLIEGVIHPYLIMILLWQIVFSIGEAFYSPRVYEYAVAIAPKGQEASYASLSAVPLLMGKLINSAAFAGLLTRFCPAEGPRDPGKMWLIVGLMVLVAPIGLLVFRRFIRVPEEGREE